MCNYFRRWIYQIGGKAICDGIQTLRYEEWLYMFSAKCSFIKTFSIVLEPNIGAHSCCCNIVIRKRYYFMMNWYLIRFGFLAHLEVAEPRNKGLPSLLRDCYFNIYNDDWINVHSANILWSINDLFRLFPLKSRFLWHKKWMEVNNKVISKYLIITTPHIKCNKITFRPFTRTM